GSYAEVDQVRLGTIPDEVLVTAVPEAVEGINAWLSEIRGKKVTVFLPQRGTKKKLVDMAVDNANHAFREKRRENDELEARLTDVQKRLRLPTLPRVIECCDISHHQGGDTVGAVVCLRDGKPDKKRYRSFNVTVTDEGDDYGAMYEVLARRFRRGRDAESGAWELPDLFVVDGGRGQLNVALTAARDLGLHDLAICGLAKERENIAGEKLVDRVYLPGQKNGIQLKPTSSSLYFLAMARDEAHRFANRGRKSKGKKRQFQSELDSIKGIGPVARKALLRELGSMSAVRAADDVAILAVQGVTRRHLRALRAVIPAPVADGPPPPEGSNEASSWTT
ncbi:MAG: hypothetical protein AAGA56_30030, partial [Myxococcota bacterium]